MKYCPEIVKEICGYIKEGNNQKDSAALAGIHVDTFHEWLKKAEFSESIKKAESVCKQYHIANIKKAGAIQWQASAWWLERKHNNEFALKTILSGGANGEPITLQLVNFAGTVNKKLQISNGNSNGNGHNSTASV